MHLLNRVRSLHTHAALWVVLPMLLVMMGMIATGIFAYQSLVTAIIIERQNEMASLGAVSVSQVIESYADILEAVAGRPSLRDRSPDVLRQALAETSEVLEIFNAGLMVVDQQGSVLIANSSELAFLGNNISELDTFRNVRETLRPSYSSVISSGSSGKAYVLIAVPLLNEEDRFGGAVYGAINLAKATLSEPIKKLTFGFSGSAYLVDQQGFIIAHPEPGEIGRDYSDRPFVVNVIEGRNGGSIWDSPEGERLVGSSALVPSSGWGLVVKEPWASIIAPIHIYSTAIGVIGLVATFAVFFLAWQGVQRIVLPIQSLSEQTNRLATGGDVEPVDRSSILEIDTLEKAFAQMAEQIEAYRAGMRRYVGAITQSQEEERRRISRELHDDTVQSLLTIHRHLELYQATESDLERQAQLADLLEIVDETLSSLRQISYDLRPLALEDLGLVPALQMLVRSMRKGIGAIPSAKFEVSGDSYPLGPDQELAIYRITQEALTNVRKHARATGVRVNLSFSPQKVALEIFDDGVGFEAPNTLTELAQVDSYGLIGIQERVWAAGGKLFIQSGKNQGTRMCVTIPVKQTLLEEVT